MAATYTAIATTTLTTTASSITFNSIPSTYTELCLVISGKFNTLASSWIRFNGSNTGYTGGRQYATTSTTSLASSQFGASPEAIAGVLTDGGDGIQEIWIPGYKDTNNRKGYFSKVQANYDWIGLWWGSWSTTSAITSIELGGNGTYQIGTTATIFGVLAQENHAYI